MFIYVIYKDAPELSTMLRRSPTSESSVDAAIERSLLVNPLCPVRIMLEYIRKKCRLGVFTNFDLCDESGGLMGLFNMPTYAYAVDKFDHKKTYYIIVLKQEGDKSMSVLPQLNRENKLYEDLKARVKKFILTGDTSPQGNSPLGKMTPTSKAASTAAVKPALKKK